MLNMKGKTEPISKSILSHSLERLEKAFTFSIEHIPCENLLKVKT